MKKLFFAAVVALISIAGNSQDASASFNVGMTTKGDALATFEFGFIGRDGICASGYMQHYANGSQMGGLMGIRVGYTFIQRDQTNLNGDRPLLQLYAGPSYLLRSSDKVELNKWMVGGGVRAWLWPKVSVAAEYVNGSVQVMIGCTGWL